MKNDPETRRRVTVKFFALLREQARCDALTLETFAPSPAALYEELRRTHALTVPAKILSYAVNERYVPADTPLREGDRVAFIPPIAGG